MHSKSDNIEIVIHDNANEVIQKRFESPLSISQTGLEEFKKGSNFIFDCVHFWHCKCHKIKLKRDESFMNSLDWVKNKKAAINPINNDDKSFQCAATVALNNDEIVKNSQKI